MFPKFSVSHNGQSNMNVGKKTNPDMEYYFQKIVN